MDVVGTLVQFVELMTAENNIEYSIHSIITSDAGTCRTWPMDVRRWSAYHFGQAVLEVKGSTYRFLQNVLHPPATKLKSRPQVVLLLARMHLATRASHCKKMLSMVMR